MIVIWFIVTVLLISAAGWVGFKMGQQVAVQEVRRVESRLRHIEYGSQCFTVEGAAFYDGKESAFEEAADMLNELCERIDP